MTEALIGACVVLALLAAVFCLLWRLADGRVAAAQASEVAAITTRARASEDAERLQVLVDELRRELIDAVDRETPGTGRARWERVRARAAERHGATLPPGPAPGG
ncbi:MAG: hypothetical protein SFW67_35470 [Myxococcaceae bacterium]|nr:hypothetical protein [Myxococcaceae bacterium]